MAVEGPLKVRRQEAVLHVHPGREAELGDAAQDECLIGRLLRVLAEEDDPADVERPVDVVVAAVHVQRVLGEGPRHHLHDHRRGLAGRVVVLLDAVDDALARREVDHAPPAHRVGDRAALGRVLALGLDGQRVPAEDVQPPFRERLLVQLAPFGGGRDGVENPRVGDPRLGVVRDELVAVRRDALAGVLGTSGHCRVLQQVVREASGRAKRPTGSPVWSAPARARPPAQPAL